MRKIVAKKPNLLAIFGDDIGVPQVSIAQMRFGLLQEGQSAERTLRGVKLAGGNRV